MLDKLVATGDPDADAYLRIARDIHVLTVALAKATGLLEAGHPQGVVMWPPSIDVLNPVGYEDANYVVACASDLMEEAWGRASRHYRSALARDERTADLADLHVGRLWDPRFSPDA